MNAMGVDYTCLFPTPMLSFGLHPQVEVEVALSRGYNRWLCERVLAQRAAADLAALPAVQRSGRNATRRCKEFGDKKGVVGFLVTGVRYNAVHENEYMKTYALIEEMGKPLAFHAAYNWQNKYMEQMNRFISVHALGFPYYNILHMTNLVINGIFERFPKLQDDVDRGRHRLGAVPDAAARQRIHDAAVGSAAAQAAAERIHGGAVLRHAAARTDQEPQAPGSDVRRDQRRDATLCFSTDYPHWDFDLPSTIYDLPFLSEEAKRNILGGNAAKLFGLKPWQHDKAGKPVYAG